MGMGETWVEIVTIEWCVQQKKTVVQSTISSYIGWCMKCLFFYCPVLEHASVLYSFLWIASRTLSA